MADAYTNMVQAQARIARIKAENADIRREEKMANYGLAGKAVTGIAKLRKDVIEKAKFGEKTAEGLQKFTMKTDGGFGTAIRRAFLPTQDDFQLTRAGQTERDSVVNTARGFFRQDNFDYSSLPEAPKGDVIGKGVLETVEATNSGNSFVGTKTFSAPNEYGNVLRGKDITPDVSGIGLKTVNQGATLLNVGSNALTLIGGGKYNKNPIQREAERNNSAVNIGKTAAQLALASNPVTAPIAAVWKGYDLGKSALSLWNSR